jgi:selenocysteine lyase/cysteine desulfurase
MINITGQILPVRKICDMAHERGVQVMVDGAHSFAHFKFTIPDRITPNVYTTTAELDVLVNALTELK